MRKFWSNKWVKFSVVSVLYVLLCVVWTGNLWMLLGLPIIYDIYISKLFYKYIWHYNDRLRERSALYNSMWGWVDAILWATVAATLLHLFVFQLYKVPTSSMEKTILIGDYLYVSKVTYGPQVPNTPIASTIKSAETGLFKASLVKEFILLFLLFLNLFCFLHRNSNTFSQLG